MVRYDGCGVRYVSGVMKGWWHEVWSRMRRQCHGIVVVVIYRC